MNPPTTLAMTSGQATCHQTRTIWTTDNRGYVVTPQEEADDRNQKGVFPALSVRAHAQGWSSPGVNPYDHEDDEQDGRVDRSGHVSDDPSPDHRADDGHAGR